MQKLLKNVFGVIALAIGLIFFVFQIFLPLLTNHNKTLIMPNILGLYIHEAEEILKKNNLRYKVVENNLFTLTQPTSAIIEQNPIPDSIIKPGRTVYIKLNPSSLPLIAIPRLEDQSIRNVYSIINSLGFKLGTISYITDIADNVIIHAYLDDKKLQADEKIPIGSSIDLLVGVNKLETEIPNFYGVPEQEIELRLLENKLQLGNVSVEEGSEENFENRIVVRQSRIYRFVQCGTKIDIELGQAAKDEDKEEENAENAET